MSRKKHCFILTVMLLLAVTVVFSGCTKQLEEPVFVKNLVCSSDMDTEISFATNKKYDRYVGEIAGFGYSPSGVVDAWMNSSGHKNQILADYNTSMAVGVYYDEYTAASYYIVIFR